MIKYIPMFSNAMTTPTVDVSQCINRISSDYKTPIKQNAQVIFGQQSCVNQFDFIQRDELFIYKLLMLGNSRLWRCYEHYYIYRHGSSLPLL